MSSIFENEFWMNLCTKLYNGDNHFEASSASHRFFNSMYLRFITLTSLSAFAFSFFNSWIRCSSLIGKFSIRALSPPAFCPLLSFEVD